jgi:L-amino acid N-acyltransferase YncA
VVEYLRMNRADPTQRRFISVVVLVLCGAALLAIAEILSGNGFDETSGRVLISAAAFSFFLLVGMAGQSLTVTRPTVSWVGLFTILVATLGLIATLIATWKTSDNTGDAKAAAVMALASLALGHSSLLLRARRPDDNDLVTFVNGGTVVVVCLLAALISIDILGGGISAQGIAVLAVLYALGTLLMPLVRRIGPTGAAVAGTEATLAPPAPEPVPPVTRSAATPSADVSVRNAYAADAEAIAAIYNQGIEERQATFQTRPHDPGELELKTEQLGGQLLVAELDGRVVGWAGWSAYDDRADYYAGIAECAVYVGRDARGQGVGASLLNGLADEASKFGVHKLVAKIFTTNESSVALFRRCGFREVGTHIRHGQLDGQWKDVLVMERSLPNA